MLRTQTSATQRQTIKTSEIVQKPLAFMALWDFELESVIKNIHEMKRMNKLPVLEIPYTTYHSPCILENTHPCMYNNSKESKHTNVHL